MVDLCEFFVSLLIQCSVKAFGGLIWGVIYIGACTPSDVLTGSLLGQRR